MSAADRFFFVYILASARNGTVYVGMTDDLARRMFEHREGLLPSFTKEHGVKRLVWFEPHASRDGLPPRAADQAVAARVEASADRGGQPDVAGPEDLNR